MRGKRLPDPEDLLAGRASADLPTLVSLVHRVNPTDRGLGRTETERRYALKSRLQSLLLRRYPEQVTVRGSGDDEVLLEVPSDGRDAGHAKVSSLDEDVRPFVRSRTDAVPTPAPAAERRAAPERRSTSPAASLAPEAALEAGDYEAAAEAWLARARRGDVAAAREGLAVLVDWLGDADRAVREREALPPAVADDAGVRVVLARGRLADGDADGAEELVGEALGADAGAVWVALADRRLADGDRTAARRALDRLTRVDPARRQEALDRSARLRALEDIERAPLRAAVDGALAGSGDVEAALAALERSFPRDPHALAVRERLRRDEAATRARVRLAEARSAVDAGRWELAARLVTELGDAAVDPAAVADLRERLRRGRAEAAVVATRERLAERLTVEAVAAWLALDPEDRRRARPEPCPPALQVAEELATAVRRDPLPLAQAALAVAHARGLVDAGRAEEASAALDVHEPLVDACRTGRALRAELRRWAASRASASARAAIAQGRALLAVDPAGALVHLERVAPTGLDPADARSLAEAIDEARRAAEDRAHEARLAEALRAAPWRAEELARTAEERARVAAAMRDAVVAVRLGPASPPSTLVMASHGTKNGVPARIVAPDGRTALLAESLGSALALHRVRLPDLEVEDAVVIRLPVPVGDGVAVTVPAQPLVAGAPDEAWVTCGGGLLLVLDLETLAPRRWTVLEHVALGSVEVSELGVCYADERSPKDRCWCVLDPATLRTTARGRSWEAFRMGVPGLAGAVVERDRAFFDRVHRDGTTRTYGPVRLRQRPSAVALHPGDPDGLLVQLRSELRTHEIAVFGAQGEPRSAHRVTSRSTIAYLGADPATGLLFQLWQDPDGSFGVVRAGDPDGHRVWQVRTTANALLLQSAGGGPVGILLGSEDGLRFRWLGREAPELPPPDHLGHVGLVRNARSCDGRALRRVAPPALRDAIALAPEPVAAAREAIAGGSSPELVLRALIDLGHDLPADLLDGLSEPLGGAVRIHWAERLCAERRWAEAWQLLEPIVERLPPERACHAHHLLWHAGMLIAHERAGEHVRHVTSACDDSGFDEYRVRTETFAAEPTIDHLAVVKVADGAAEEGQVARALELLTQPSVLYSGDLQAAARRLWTLRAAPEPPSTLDVLRARWLFDSCRGDAPMATPWTTARIEEERRRIDELLAGTPFEG